MLDQYDKITEACAEILARDPRLAERPPVAGIILGSGLGAAADAVRERVVIPYGELPHFALSTATGHAGQLVCGVVDGAPVLVLEGRMHAYEGYSLAQITFPVRVLQRLGSRLLVVTNACGGLNPHYRTGDIMVIDDHINPMTDWVRVFPTCRPPTHPPSTTPPWPSPGEKISSPTGASMSR
jgi:purine-nucleoside phosphorylase